MPFDPIVACATPWGHGAVAVVRLSGAELRPVVEAVCGPLPEPWRLRRVRLRDAEGVFDEGLLSWFPGPRSYTGEDVAEVSCHGNPLLVERLIAAFGVRVARPGEFTRRAFLHGKMDLTRAEAVLQAIHASSRAGLDLARAGLEGRVADRVSALADGLTDLAAELEAVLDYPGEDLLVLDDAALLARLAELRGRLIALADSWRAGHHAVEGARVALVGPPNAGKSSLFNALLGRERALVSAVPGTTRDYVEAPLALGALRITLIDTAGEHEAEDALERAGIQLGRRAAVEADLVLRCVPLHEAGPLPGEGLLVGTFADLPARRALPLRVSARTGEGLDRLRRELQRALVGEEPGAVREMLASARQRDLCRDAAARLEEAAAALPEAGPAVAVEQVYAAMEALGELTGAGVREAVLDRLFARFCVGK